MAWIESHQELDDHPKTRKAAQMLGVSVPTIIGHLHILWHWALSYAQDGDLTDFDATDIAMAARWEGDAQKFVDAMLCCRLGAGRAGFLERTADNRLVLHDWWEYAGKLVAKRQKDAARKRAEREAEAAQTTQDVPSTSVGHPADVAGTVPNLTVPNQSSSSDDDTAAPEATTPEPGVRVATSKPLTEGQAYFLEMFGAKRYKNAIQRETIGKLETQYGMTTLRQATEWAAKQGMALGRAVPSVEKALTHWDKPKSSPTKSSSVAERPDPQQEFYRKQREMEAHGEQQQGTTGH